MISDKNNNGDGCDGEDSSQCFKWTITIAVVVMLLTTVGLFWWDFSLNPVRKQAGAPPMPKNENKELMRFKKEHPRALDIGCTFRANALSGGQQTYTILQVLDDGADCPETMAEWTKQFTAGKGFENAGVYFVRGEDQMDYVLKFFKSPGQQKKECGFMRQFTDMFVGYPGRVFMPRMAADHIIVDTWELKSGSRTVRLDAKLEQKASGKTLNKLLDRNDNPSKANDAFWTKIEADIDEMIDWFAFNGIMPGEDWNINNIMYDTDTKLITRIDGCGDVIYTADNKAWVIEELTKYFQNEDKVALFEKKLFESSPTLKKHLHRMTYPLPSKPSKLETDQDVKQAMRYCLYKQFALQRPTLRYTPDEYAELTEESMKAIAKMRTN